MVTPLPHPGADSSLMERVPPTIVTTPGGMILNLSRPPPCPPHVSRWDFNFLLLLKFRDREGHLRVPKRHVEDGRRLGAWIDKQRTNKNASSLLPVVEERRLNEIGFIWKAHEEKWETMIRALTQFKEREGHCKVAIKHIENLDDGVKLKLGAWLSQQRYLQKSESLDAQKEKQFESLGVKWNNRKQEIAEEHFDRNFDLLIAFREREGHVRVPIKHQESATDTLGIWLTKQRCRHRRGALELDRQKWLEVAGVTWERWSGA